MHASTALPALHFGGMPTAFVRMPWAVRNPVHSVARSNEVDLTMQLRHLFLARSASASLLIFSTLAGGVGVDQAHSPRPDADFDALEALEGTQSAAEIDAIIHSCDPSTLLVEPESGRVLAAIRLPGRPVTLDEALRNPTLVGKPDCGGKFRLGYRPFVFGNPLLGIYG